MSLAESHHADRVVEPAITLWLTALTAAGTTLLAFALFAQALGPALG